MEEYYVGNQKVMINFDGLKRIGGGMEGDIYQYKKGVLIKRFHSDRPSYLWPIEEKQLKGIQNVNLRLIGLPLKLVYDHQKKNVVGYTMRQFYDIVRLYRMHHIQLSNIIRMLKDFEKEICEMSRKVRVGDIKIDSIWYSKSKKKLCLLDSSGYRLIKPDEDPFEAYRDNFISLNEIIINQLLLADAAGHNFDLTGYDLPDVFVSVYTDGTFLSEALESEQKRTGCHTIKELREVYRKDRLICKNMNSKL